MISLTPVRSIRPNWDARPDFIRRIIRVSGHCKATPFKLELLFKLDKPFKYIR